jgi:large subunit ribosomal protein L35
VASRVLKGKIGMPKIKTRKTAAKRFKVTGSGKLMRGNTGRNHLMMKKSASQKRRLSLESTVAAGERQKVQRMVPGITS